LELGLIDRQQQVFLVEYLQNPFEKMRGFLMENPGFLTEALASPDEKVRTRTRLLVDGDLYNLNGTESFYE
jgi:hypothetical protein